MNIFEEVRKLNFPPRQYVVVGSGPMAARGIREIRDIDIVVSPEFFEKCKQDGWEQVPWTYSEKLEQVYLKQGVVELYLDVNCGNFNPKTDELIQRADVIDGIPFASLEDVIRFKKEYNKPKHLADIKLIAEYLKNNFDPHALLR